MKYALLHGLVLACLGTVTASVAAQFKWQTPEGRTVYSDMPPPPGATALNGSLDVKVPPAAADAASGASAVPLPYELRVTSGKFPVVLFTAPNCEPCESARKHLAARGIPYAEKSISTTADLDAFKTQGLGENSFPALTVGREKSVGYEAGAYDRLLTIAGYPTASRLPAGYRQAAAVPLAAPAERRPEAILPGEALPGSPALPNEALPPIEGYRRQTLGEPGSPSGSGPSMRF